MIFANKKKNSWCGAMTPRRIGWFLSLQDVLLATTAHMAMDGQKSARTSTWNQGVKNGVRLGVGRYRFEARLQEGVHNWFQGWRALPTEMDRVISRTEILRTGRWLNPKVWDREIMEKLRPDPHSEPLTDTWTSDFLTREGEVREVVGERLRDKTVHNQQVVVFGGGGSVIRVSLECSLAVPTHKSHR